MIHLELTTEEEQHLKEEVQKRLIELDHEIAHTDTLEFKDMLKRRREALRKLLEKLPDAAAIATETWSQFVQRHAATGREDGDLDSLPGVDENPVQ